jgi:membrane-associated protein
LGPGRRKNLAPSGALVDRLPDKRIGLRAPGGVTPEENSSSIATFLSRAATTQAALVFSCYAGEAFSCNLLCRGTELPELRQLIAQLYNVRGLIEWGGTLLVCAIVFIETGMFAGFFLPGDSLLVTAGVFAGAGQLKLAELLSFVTLCAIAGDQVGYFLGWKAGDALYRREDSRFFKKRHLERAHEFYEHYGGKTVILARFVPIIRTFCPPVAGAARMRYRVYLAYDIVGGFLWVWGMTLLGYTLGRTVPNIDKRIHYVIAAVIVASFIPAVYHASKQRKRSLNQIAAHADSRPSREIQPENEP